MNEFADYKKNRCYDCKFEFSISIEKILYLMIIKFHSENGLRLFILTNSKTGKNKLEKNNVSHIKKIS